SAMRHAIHTAFKSAAERVLPVRSESGFKTHGVLTPDEFVRSGDYLVRTCSTWSWEAGDPAKSKDWLPKDKQYLVTRKVPSNKRASELEQYGMRAEANTMVEDAEQDGWVAPPATQDTRDAEEIPSSHPESAAGPSVEARTNPEDDIPDIDDLELEDDEAEKDEAMLPQAAAITSPGADQDHIMRTRTYDLMITYDKYYQVPRFWLVGYDEKRQPLKPNQVLEDVSEEHARKTITVDPFPNTGVLAASIHPCKHASVMKKLASMAEASGKPFQVDSYLVLFLKFIASVIPTIEYDYTMAAGW
ncbi:autophagocytosis protein, partial [Coccomyxa subellipsoidea C-169]